MTDRAWIGRPIEIGGTVEFSLEQFQTICPGNPVGRTFTWSVENRGEIYTYTGVPCVVDGDRITFVLDDSVLLTRRPKDA